MPAPSKTQPLARALLTTREAAEYLNVKPNTLDIWRMKGAGPRYVRLGTGTRQPIRYSIKDLDAYIEACAVKAA